MLLEDDGLDVRQVHHHVDDGELEAGIFLGDLLDGGGLRTNTHELLEYIDVAIVAERLCEQMDMTPEKMLDYLKSRGCRVGGVTLGERGLYWYDEAGTVRTLPALPIPRGKGDPDGGGLSSNHPGMRGIFLLLESTRQLR